MMIDRNTVFSSSESKSCSLGSVFLCLCVLRLMVILLMRDGLEMLVMLGLSGPGPASHLRQPARHPLGQ